MMAPLVNLVVPKEAAETMRAESREWPSWYLNARQLSDLELLSCGAFSPLTGFLSRLDYDSVVRNQRLDAGTPWPIPIVLDVTESFAATVTAGKSIALRDPEGVMLAALRVQDMWLPDLRAEADAVFGGTAHESPDASILSGGTNPVYLGGPVHATQLPTHYDYRQLRLTPAQVRAEFARRGWSRVMALQSCHLIHRARQEATMRAAREVNAKLLIQALVGGTSPGDVEHYSRIRCYQATIGNYPPDTAMMCLVPMAPRCTGPREALWRGIISRNYGCTHVAFGAALSEPDVTPERDQAEPSHPPSALETELAIRAVHSPRMVYVRELDRYLPEQDVPAGAHVLRLSETELRGRLAHGEELPHWFTLPEVARELQRVYPPRHRQGFTVFFTGLSGSGKSTIANILRVRLMELGGRRVTLLDGDLVRTHLSSELGFSREHREINVRRIGYVASEITKNGGVAICAPIAPYEALRQDVRRMIEPFGGFALVHVATPIEVCEQRDRKGLYAKARAGLISQFTGISAPYEPPAHAEILIDTVLTDPDAAADRIVEYLASQGYLRRAG